MSRYERVAATDIDSPISPTTNHIPTSPPPSFRSRESSPPRRAAVDQNLADAFDADGSDSDEENDGDDRQRLMRGTPTETTASSAATSIVQTAAVEETPSAPQEQRSTYIPAFVPPPQPASGRVYGGGSGSDGVFANLSAKPERGEKLEEHPPTYEQAAADAAPPYWETTILAPGFNNPDEVYIDGLPVGSAFSFFWNAMISMSFPLVGFLLTYLLHTTHGAKNGSRAGLGVTLIQYGFSWKATINSRPTPGDSSGQTPPDPNAHDFDPGDIAGGDGSGGVQSTEWVAYALMIVGWFILIRSISDFLRARRHEQLVLQSPDRGLGTAVIADGESSERVV